MRTILRHHGVVGLMLVLRRAHGAKTRHDAAVTGAKLM
jgi:hypothetical protein